MRVAIPIEVYRDIVNENEVEDAIQKWLAMQTDAVTDAIRQISPSVFSSYYYYVRCPDCGNWSTRMISPFYSHQCTCGQTVYRCFMCDSFTTDPIFDSEDQPACPDCVDSRLRFCDNCGVWTSSGASLCLSCEEDLAPDIHSYDHKPRPIFYGGDQYSDLMLGVELEVDGFQRESRSNAADELNYLSENDNLFYLKEDGSLTYGFEVVSHPATLQYHLTKFPWEKITSIVKSCDGKSHNTSTCGLHVHFNTAFLGDKQYEQDYNTLKILYLINKFWPHFVALSRRRPEALTQWASKYSGEFETNKVDTENLYKVRDIKSYHEKYRSVNISNTHTIEIRIFRGTLVIPTLFATLELVDYLVRFAKQHSALYLHKATWHLFCSKIQKRYRYLPQYIAERDIAGTDHEIDI